MLLAWIRRRRDTRNARRQHAGERSSELPARIQRIECDLALPRLLRELHAGIEQFVAQGLEAAASVEAAGRIWAAPPPRGRAGGRARARYAWRFADGTFMSENEKHEIMLELRERYARAGRARAATALRYLDGSFAPNQD